MTLSDFANLATIVQGIFVIVSIGFIWYQLRETTRLARAANTQALVTLSLPFYLQVAQDREMTALWFQHGAKEWNKMDEIDKARHRELLLWWLIFHENVYHQWKKKLIDDETYTTWGRGLEDLMEHTPKECWEDLMSTTPFEASFVEHLHQLRLKQIAVKETLSRA
jgi:hypothetical protein